LPDITTLDSHFTPYHSSSKNYSTFNCSAHYSLAIVRSRRFGSILTNYPLSWSARWSSISRFRYGLVILAS